MIRRVFTASSGVVRINRSRYPLLWVSATIVWNVSMVAQAAVGSGHWSALLHPSFVLSSLGVVAGSLLGKSALSAPPWDGNERRKER